MATTASASLAQNRIRPEQFDRIERPARRRNVGEVERWLCGIGGGNNGFIFFHNTANRTMIHQMNLPMPLPGLWLAC